MDVIPVADYFGLPELCERLEAMKEPDVTQNNNNNADVIRLDVSGTILKTTRATLTQDPDSHLAKMFTPGSNTSPPLTEEGAYFIDACPKAVKFVLTSLISRRLILAENQSYNSCLDVPEDMPEKDLEIAAQTFALKLSNIMIGEICWDRSKVLFSSNSTDYHLIRDIVLYLMPRRFLSFSAYSCDPPPYHLVQM